jgi:hypothetical protein
MELDELRPGLFRWTAPHPAWAPGAAPDTPNDWPEEVGCVAYAAPDRLVLIDPQLPRDEAEGWCALDSLVAAHGPRVTVLTTMRFHRRSRARIVERYGAERPRIAAARVPGVETLPIAGGDETLVWLPRPRALVTGDRLIGARGGGVRICPESWIEYLPDTSVDDLRRALLPLLELPIELVLVSHFEPVLSDGRAALAAALAG